MTLEIKREVDALKKMYVENKAQDTGKFLVLGDSGTGKTRLALTCPRPVLVHSFDPGGTKTLKSGIDEGWIIPDTRFEGENDKQPTMYKVWEDEFNRLGKVGMFDHIGTYVLDSTTTWADALMNNILKGSNRIGCKPEFEDWRKLLDGCKYCMKQITNLPCHVLVTGHLTYEKDEADGRIRSSLAVSGQSATKIPILFDEIYIMRPVPDTKGVRWRMQVSNDGKYTAATRMGNGKFELFEEPDIMKLFGKAGWDVKHKEIV